MSDALVRKGRVWKFGDNINTDLIMPNTTFRLPVAEQHKLVFSANRPGWVEQVQSGDLLVAGRNFGMGSGRPIGRLMTECGIGGIVVETVNGTGLRGCVNYGMPIMECAGILDLVDEGDTLSVDYPKGVVSNVTKGSSLQGRPLPDLLGKIITSGGVFKMLIEEGYISEQPTVASST